MKKLTKTFLLLFTLNSCLTYAQTYDISQVAKRPRISNSDMKKIAYYTWKAYEKCIETPEKYSTQEASIITVNAFYEYDEGRGPVYVKTNPINGKIYNPSDKESLIQNNRILFNLSFKEDGTIILPEKLYVISHREFLDPQKNRASVKTGFIAFEIEITDSLKKQLESIKLSEKAGIDINSLTKTFKPVSIEIPIDVYKTDEKLESEKYGKGNYERKIANNITGTIEKNKDEIIITKDKKEYSDEFIIKYLKTNSEIEQYKKGKFEYQILIYRINISSTFNYLLGGTTSYIDNRNCGGGIGLESYKLVKFEGAGKKIKK